MLFKDRVQFANVTRYFDLIQHVLPKCNSPFALVDIDVHAPYVARVPEEKKKSNEASKKEVPSVEKSAKKDTKTLEKSKELNTAQKDTGNSIVSSSC
jgi:hypothetical protein